MAEGEALKGHDCYRCRFMKRAPGTAHISCTWDGVAKLVNDPLLSALSIFAGAGRVGMPEIDVRLPGGDLAVELDPRGVARGWCNWPFLFDPRWVSVCRVFEAKE